MKKPGDCIHEPCGCRAERGSRFCSAECEASAAQAASDCECGHGACIAHDRSSERSIAGNQGEGNREADRRYRESASEFARSGRVEDAARKAADDLEELERGKRNRR
jgi:hypothetical protein